jgi:hypothetical protein
MTVRNWALGILYFGTLFSVTTWANFDDEMANSLTDNVYNLQATCASSGQFTEKALEQTRNIRGIIEKLKNNPACKGLTETLDVSLKNISQNLEDVQRIRSQMDAMSPAVERNNAPVGEEMQAIRTFSNGLNGNYSNAPTSQLPGFLPSALVTALSKSAMKVQRLQSVADGSPDIENNPRKSLSKEVALAMLQSKKRVQLAANTGLNIINSTIDTVSRAQSNCLDGSDPAYIASGLTQMLAAFVTGSQVSLAGTDASTAISKIVNFVSREKKYVDAIRSLNQSEFYSTLSCLLEMTSEGYCATEDAQLLLKEVKKDFNFVQTTIEPTDKMKASGAKAVTYIEPEIKNFTSLISKGPMAGHYILSNQLPIVNDWINKIQFGIDPQLPTEADFQVQTFMTGLQPFIQMKRILGDYNYRLSQLKTVTSLAAKQNLVLQMLLLVNQGFSSNARESSENFFLRVHPENRMLFSLLGIAYGDMPDEVFVAKNNMTMDPVQYVSLNFQTTMPQFKDPDQLALIIKKNAEDIFKKADLLAQQYFLQFFIPDEIAVVSESMVGMNKGDVRSALTHIDVYVDDFIKRMSSEGGDPSFLNIATNLRVRIGAVLAHYERLHKFGLELVKLNNQKPSADTAALEKQMRDKMVPMAQQFIQDVYEQFQIKKMRAGWLPNRLMIIVKKDYSMAMQKRSFSNENLKDLMMATGLEALTQLLSQSGINFSTAEMDFANARDLYRKNIIALEKVAIAPMQNYINEQRLKADPEILTQMDLWKEANRYSYNVRAEKTPIDNPNYQWLRSFTGAANNLVEGLFAGFGLVGKDVQYGWPKGTKEIFNTSLPDLTDSMDGSSQKIWARNCSIVLAFYELRPFWYLCKKATLYSTFYDEKKYEDNPAIKNFLLNELSLSFVKAAYEGLDPKINYAAPENKKGIKDQLNYNRFARICALRNHYRKNYVMQITAGLKRENELYTNEFTVIPERLDIDNEPIITRPDGTDIREPGTTATSVTNSKMKFKNMEIRN